MLVNEFGKFIAETRYENLPRDFHTRVRTGFLEIAAREPKRCVVIDGRAPRDVVADRIWSIVQERLRPEMLGIAETSTP